MFCFVFPAAHTGVFWDINDFPLPCLDPHVVYENIKSTLLNKGYTGPASIWLYANDETQIKKEDYETLIRIQNLFPTLRWV